MNKAFVVCAITMVFLHGCASPKVSVSMLMPANYSEPVKYRRVAVLPFSGPHGEEISGRLEGVLVKARLDNKPWFDVYERERLKDALKELRLSSSGLVDRKSAAKLGRFIGVQGIYMGRINDYDNDYQRYYETRYYCAAEDKKGKCIDKRKKKIRCTRRRTSVDFTPKLVDVETAKVVYSNNLGKIITDNVCGGDFYRTADMALDTAVDDALWDFREDVIPNYQSMKIVIKDSAEGLNDKAKEHFKSGVEFAKANRLDRGCDFWMKARSAGGNSLALLYNLALCAESRGDLETAEERFIQVDQMLTKPDKDISKAVMRIRNKITARQKLHRQLQ